jgi:hypothetical protein
VGAWGYGSFDNDDAMDWVGELEGADGTQLITDALDVVLQAEDYLESPDAAIGLAAAEVVAALLGRPTANLPPEVASWVAGKKPPRAALVRKAQRAVQRVLENSELKELWAESEDADRWAQEVNGLLQRLG